MPWAEAVRPVRMARVAVVAPAEDLRAALMRVADAGVVELDRTDGGGDPQGGAAARRLQRLRVSPPEPRLAAVPDLDRWERDGRADLLAGEAQLQEYAGAAVRDGEVAAVAGWCPAEQLPMLAGRLAPVGAAVVALPAPRGVDPPTLLRTEGTVRQSFSPLVRTYGTVPYVDVDPTLFAAFAYVVMFGMMFADAGHGALLMVAALLLRLGRLRRLARLRPLWLFVAGAGVASAVFGVLFGEFFGPTGVVPVVWLEPLDDPVQLLAAGVGLGAVLLALAYALGVVNRWREGGARLALYAPSGMAGGSLFLGLAGLSAGVYAGQSAVAWAGGAIAGGGLVLAAIGLYAAGGGGAAGVTEAAVQLFDLVLRLGANLVSFTRLAAFGLTHAALGGLVWAATTALWDRGGTAMLGALAVFVVGNAVTFGLEALVAGIQALRLEYYELFSRIFDAEGRAFRSWHIPIEEEVRS